MRKLEMPQIQKISLEILRQVAEICEKENLRYYLFYGTLIGAVRHHGFIPWDDDLDIMMPREDHDKLLHYLTNHASEYPNLRFFTPHSCPKYPYMISRISDDRYPIVMDNEESYGMGVFIDIYPFDGLGNSKKEALRYGNKGDRLSSLCFQASRKRIDFRVTSSGTSTFRQFLKVPVWCLAKIIGLKRLQKKLASMAYKKPYDKSKYVGCVVWLSGGIKDMFMRKWLDEYIVVPFEQYKFRIPKDYDKVLRQTYGDYMQLPPADQRVGHHFYYVKER